MATTSDSTKAAPSSVAARIQFVDVGGERIAYKTVGEGKPIIFLHRFRGTLDDWDPAFVDGVAKKYRVIMFDQPGVGRSSGSVSTSVTKWADQAATFARALGIGRAVYLSWSMGGAVAQILGIRHADEVERLVMLATGPSQNPDSAAGDPEFGRRARKPIYEVDDYEFLFFYKSPAARAACLSYLQRVAQIEDKDVPVTPDGYQNMSIAMADFKANKEQNYFEQLKAIECPTLIGNGKFDPSYPLMNSLVLEREIPNAKLIVYPDSGHGFLFQYHDQFVPELLAFLEG